MGPDASVRQTQAGPKPRPGAEADLRGCIGTVLPQESLSEAVARFAAAAAFEDHRFQPLAKAELDGVRIEVSILSPGRKAPSADAVKSGDGVSLERDGRSGVFLPQVWEKLPGKTAFLEELCSQKAGLPRDCYKDPMTEIKVFRVDSFHE